MLLCLENANVVALVGDAPASTVAAEASAVVGDDFCFRVRVRWKENTNAKLDGAREIFYDT